MTLQGLRKLGSGTLSSSGNETPGAIVPAAVTIAIGNLIGLIIVGGSKVLGEATGRSALEGRARATADEIAQSASNQVPGPRLDQLARNSAF